ncbi:MAG: Pyruvate formate-lyase 1-activating enzyme [Promethearchaeota archaeon]|nr:MAG: Pyruvate formate-lyase 1-activating enzyme [Candidatus Lokiarchaeota archaeon]
MMRIGGIVDISTKDIPGKVCMVIFTTGCNLRCEFCYNKHLLLSESGRDVGEKKLINQIKNNSLINAISITGGEPTLNPKLLTFCKKLSELDKYISLDTNGTNPTFITQIFPYINRIALDLKAPLNKEKYEQICNTGIDIEKLLRTFRIINNNSSIDFEIRTTYVKGLLNPEDIHNIIKFLREENFRGTYVIQQYQYSEGVGDEYKNKFQETTHSDIYQLLKPYEKISLPFEIYVRDDIVGYSSLENIIKMANEEL